MPHQYRGYFVSWYLLPVFTKVRGTKASLWSRRSTSSQQRDVSRGYHCHDDVVDMLTKIQSRARYPHGVKPHTQSLIAQLAMTLNPFLWNLCTKEDAAAAHEPETGVQSTISPSALSGCSQTGRAYRRLTTLGHWDVGHALT